MACATLSARAKRIRLNNKALARLAGCDAHTVRRLLGDKADTRRSKIAAIEEALTAEEQALLTHLQRLYPAKQLEDAA